MIGIFQDQRAADAVIEQLELNGIDRTTLVRASSQIGELAERMPAVAQDLPTLRLPAAQAAEYRARLERNQCLVLVEAGALALPTIQRILRNGNVVDIDLLPDTST